MNRPIRPKKEVSLGGLGPGPKGHESDERNPQVVTHFIEDEQEKGPGEGRLVEISRPGWGGYS
ncbi:hypothetical protein QJS10_CPB14g01272 [Acorus calamus]|uniref:Uncharacterized protein n=1 Tax=Acorus calamus TaxID=4465 RepID=A0AAV9DBI4_ACOCL|nr:hypothetical protein QJS10_CPB14g01272 [Acorus calamus]